MGNSPDPPKIADPNVVAGNQATLNKTAGVDSQQGSMVNQTNPFGSLSYSQTGTSPDGTPLYTANTQYTGANADLLNILQGTQKTAGQQGNALISGANYGTQQPGDVIGNATSGLTKDAMAKQVAYLQPQFDQDISKLDTKLRNQGFAPGQPGYDQAMNGLKQSQGQTVTGFEASMEPAMYQQATQNYLMPAQLGGTLAGLGSPTAPTWNSTPNLNIQSPDLIGATNSAQAAQEKTYQDQLAQSNSMMSGLFGIPTAVLGGWGKSGGLQSLLGAGGLGAGADISGSAMAGLGALGSAAII